MKRWMGLVGVVLLPACLSCLFGTGPGDGDQHDQTTVLGTLNAFVDVWNDGNIGAYESLLADDFTFHFDPQDVGGDMPRSWYYDDEIAAFDRIFSAVGAMNVTAQLDLSDVSEPGEEADTCSLNDIAYLLYVAVPALDTVIRADGRLDLELEKLDGGEWVVTEWTDHSIVRLPGIVEMTWGGLKSFFTGDDYE